MKKALITGITGQDGAYLTRHLLDLDYEVWGAFRRNSSVNFWRLEELGLRDHPNLTLAEFDLTDATSAIRLINEIRPEEIYNLAAQSFVGISFEQPIATASITAIGCLNLLEAVRILDPDIRFYQASSSEMFGKVQSMPQSEETPFYPRSPYGVSKLFAHWATINYRESYGIFGCSGILFNHESPLRGLEFVTRKISHAAASIHLNLLDVLELGNLDSARDWGLAPDFVEGMHLMLQQETPDCFVLATHRSTTVREFVTQALGAVGIDLVFEGTAESEIGIDRSTGKILIRVNPKYYRPAEVDTLLGDYSKAESALGWRPSATVESLCTMMVEADLERLKNGKSF